MAELLSPHPDAGSTVLTVAPIPADPPIPILAKIADGLLRVLIGAILIGVQCAWTWLLAWGLLALVG